MENILLELIEIRLVLNNQHFSALLPIKNNINIVKTDINPSLFTHQYILLSFEQISFNFIFDYFDKFF